MLAVSHQLATTQYLPPEEIRDLQFRQIGELVSHIDQHVSFYGVSLRQAGVKPGQPITAEAWARVPILSREDVQRAGTALYARAVPAGHGSIASATTSGSSGRPVTIRKTALMQFYWQCFVLREQQWSARDLGALWMAILRDDARSDPATTSPLRMMPDWGQPLSAVYPTGPAALVDYRCTIAEQAEILLRTRPAYLTTFPSLLLELLRYTSGTGEKPQALREVRVTGEALSDEVRAFCQSHWAVDVTNIYSAAEIGMIAVPCAEFGQMHVQSEGVLLEILRHDSVPCDIGETGRVVLTPLHNFAMPLIRYEIGDTAQWGPPCPCGRRLPVLARIPGRARDMMTLPSGVRRFPWYGHNAIMRVDAIVQHQVAQVARDRIELRLVVRRALTTDEENYIREAAEAALDRAFSVELVYRDAIARLPGGKYAEFTNEYDSGA